MEKTQEDNLRPDVPEWYVMRAYQNPGRTEEALANETYGIEYFIPKKDVIRIRHGRKVVCREPVVRSLVFVRATRGEIVRFKQNYCNDIQFVIWDREDGSRYLTVRDEDMRNFMLLYTQREVTFFTPGDINVSKGVRVRIHGGALDTLEGVFVKVAHKRRKQVVVIIPDALAISAEVDDGIIEVIG